jgi:hypothetical protein
MSKPNCYKCKARGTIPGDAHSTCANRSANVKGHRVGIEGGWFHWPFNFDPTWVVECDSFVPKSGAAEPAESPVTSANK